MGSFSTEFKLKIFCPVCDEVLYGISFFDDYYQQSHKAVCKSCGFEESYHMTISRISDENKAVN